MQIYTGHWAAPLPPEIHRIGISRGTPRGLAAGYSRMPELAPGPWFKSVTSAEFVALFDAQLAQLDPGEILERIAAKSGGRNAVLLCYEKPADIFAGKCWCHRHQVAAWLNARLQVNIGELGHPELDPFAALRAAL